MNPPLTTGGRPIGTSDDRFGRLDDATPLRSDPAGLRRRFVERGHVFLRGLLPPETVLAAREEILTKYAVLGEIDDRSPIMDGVAGDRSGLVGANLRAFTHSVRTGAHYESVILDPELLRTVGVLLDGDAVPFSFRWPRLVRPGEGCGFHCDGPYMSRATTRHLSCWIPLGHIAPHEGGLVVLDGSHDNHRLAEGYLTKDADLDGLEWLEADPEVVRSNYGDRWLTADYEPGDVLIFSMSTLHGAFDNHADRDRCRLSTDSRYYAAGETPDPRWNGDDLAPHGGERVFYPGLGSWANADFQDEWKYVDEHGRLVLPASDHDTGSEFPS